MDWAAADVILPAASSRTKKIVCKKKLNLDKAKTNIKQQQQNISLISKSLGFEYQII